MARDDEELLDDVNKSYKDEQDEQQAQEERTPIDDAIDEVKGRAKDEIKDKVDEGKEKIKDKFRNRGESEPTGVNAPEPGAVEPTATPTSTAAPEITGVGTPSGAAPTTAPIEGAGAATPAVEGAGAGTGAAGAEATTVAAEGAVPTAFAPATGAGAGAAATGEAATYTAATGATGGAAATGAAGGAAGTAAAGGTAGTAAAGTTATVVGGGTVTAGSFATGIGEVAAIVAAVIAVVVVILMLIVGYVFYFLSMPGTIKGNINEIIKETRSTVISNIWERATGSGAELDGNSISVEKRIELLQYIEDMGIGVVGYGFVPGVRYLNDERVAAAIENSENYEELKEKYKDEILENSNNKSNIIIGYDVKLIDNDSVISNSNNTSNGSTSSSDDLNIIEETISSGGSNVGNGIGNAAGYAAGLIANISSNMQNLPERIRNAYKKMNPKDDLMYFYLMANERAYIKKDDGILGKFFTINKWTGMLDIENERSLTDYLNPVGSELNRVTANVDRENEVLIVKKRTGINSEEVYSFPLDGWTGRYGMPLEFSLALHLATMSSGMVEEMITTDNHQTTVTIGLSETRCTARLTFYVRDAEGNVRGLTMPYDDPEGDEDRLYKKIDRNQQVNIDDLSIEGLHYVYKTIDEDDTGRLQHVHDVLEVLGYEYFTKERIDYLYDELKDQHLNDDEVVQYVQPYIKRVIKHWFKDVDFTSSYGTSNEPITRSYPLDQSIIGDNVDVVVELTPIGGGSVSSNGGQPLVIKGDIVLCDGEIVDARPNSNEVDGYRWGDGYRTTKKIFTQGYYYTFDGTNETARSIYYQEEMEQGVYDIPDEINEEKVKKAEVSELPAQGEYTRNLYAFGVNSGRIVTAKRVSDGRTVLGGFKQTDIINSNREFLSSFTSSPNVECVYDDNGITVYSIGSEVEGNIGRDIHWYVMYVSGHKDNYALRYKSPVDYSQEEVEARVQVINDVWESAGIVCKRKHLTLDTVAENESEIADASNAQIMAKTGLTILKNTNTQDAEYIYRDLKEMLIDLGYYTEAEFDVFDTNVLMWLVPDFLPETWPQNTGNDIYETAAILYPKSEIEEADEESSEERQRLINLGIEIDKSLGFEPDLNVVAPGDCKIIRKGQYGVELEFTCEEEPEISMLDGYTMIIEGMNTDAGITLIDEDGAETSISFDAAISQQTIIKAGSVIGKTADRQIKVFMLNDRGEYLSNIEDYMAPERATAVGSGDNFSLTGTVLSEREFVDSCLSYMTTYNKSNSDFSEENLKQMYRICKQKHINPEWMFVTAIWETSLGYRDSHNYWGLAAYNGGDGGSVFSNITQGVTAYCDLLIEYQNPTSSYYSMIMSKYEERRACTENGGCSPNGYGTPDTVQGVQSIYSYVGLHTSNDSDAGGKYYLDPAVAGVTAIYRTHEEYLQKCAGPHSGMIEPTVWEDNQYNAWQVERRIETAKSIFGDRAGSAMY